jgi:uncharacterized membrane protein
MLNALTDLGLSFARPNALWLLATLPVFAALGIALGVRRRRLPRAALGLRLLVVTLLAVTLADPLLTSGGGSSSTVFLVDRSRSLTAETAGQVERWVADALGAADPGDRAAVVSFGAEPVVAQPAAAVAEVDGGWAEAALPGAGGEYTDVESALGLARALPLGGSGRIVLISDGAENVGSALDQAAQATADGVPIDVVPLPGVGADDLRIDGASAPASTWRGEPFGVLVSVASGSGGDGTVELLIDGVVADARQVAFAAGRSSFQFNVADLAPGFHALEVRVSPTTAADAYAENNAQPLAVVVRDQPAVLLVAPSGADPGLLRGAMERRGAVVTGVIPAEVPSRLSELGAYDAIVLDNVAADALTLDQLAGLQEAARSLGRGLIVLGGTSSYGPGAYAGTILEETLPVTVRVTDGREREKVALLLIVDRSGSMSYDPLGGTSKIDMAKEAIRLAADSLADGDTVGVLAFDDDQQWVVEMMEITGDADRGLIATKVAEIQPEGGTEIYPALSLGLDAIANTEADVRHVVLLTDGKSRTGTRESYQKLIDEVVTQNTTLSTIAIGDDADKELLQFLAEAGDGNYHPTNRPEDIPRITLEEARSAGRQSVLRGAFQPIQTQASPIMTGIEPESLPPLDGYDFAEAKPDAQVVLASDRNDPLLTKWQYGLGRVVAWTGDDGADFATAWASWQGYDAFWSNVVRWALPDPEARPLQVGVERDGPEAILTVDAVDAARGASEAVGLAETSASITAPDGTVSDLTLYQSGPGQYQVRVAAPQPGAYRVALRQTRADGQVVDELAGFAVPPSPELRPSDGGEALLRALATRTGGRVLSLDDADLAFADTGLRGTPLRHYRAVWYVPLALGLLALLVEIAVRTGFLPWRRPRA